MTLFCKDCMVPIGDIPSLLSEVPKGIVEKHKQEGCKAKFYSQVQVSQAFTRMFTHVDSPFYNPYLPHKELVELVRKELGIFLSILEKE